MTVYNCVNCVGFASNY